MIDKLIDKIKALGAKQLDCDKDDVEIDYNNDAYTKISMYYDDYRIDSVNIDKKDIK